MPIGHRTKGRNVRWLWADFDVAAAAEQTDRHQIELSAFRCGRGQHTNKSMLSLLSSALNMTLPACSTAPAQRARSYRSIYSALGALSIKLAGQR